MDEPTERAALSVDEAAARLGVSRGLFYKLLREGEGPRTVKLYRRRVVLVEELERWLHEREEEYGVGGQT